MALPNFQSSVPELNLMQSQWAAQIEPVLKVPLVKGVQLERVQLQVGTNSINHRLGRKLQGWTITRLRGPATIYDTQDSNTLADLTLTLNSSATVVVDIWVY